MKKSVAPFGNESIRLRLIQEDDLDTTLSWRNRDDVRIWFKSSAPLTIDQHRDWFFKYLEKPDDFLFVAEADGNLVGQASVYQIDHEKGSAEIGRFLAAPEYRGRGFIQQACAELIKWCGNQQRLSHLYLEVFEHNHRAIRIYSQCGFLEEARYDDLIRMSWRAAQEGD